MTYVYRSSPFFPGGATGWRVLTIAEVSSAEAGGRAAEDYQVVFVAERRQERQLGPWSKWAGDPLAHMLSAPDGWNSPSMRNACRLLHPPSFRWVNLLPPDPRPGKWDAGLAWRCARRLEEWALAEGQDLVLLGRRVERAFRAGGRLREFGEIEYRSVRFLFLPHPSGRCREWNDPLRRAAMRAAFDGFIGRDRV